MNLLNKNKNNNFIESNESNKVKQKININFTSIDQKINFNISCFNKDNFSIIEEKIFNEYPKLKNKEIHFFGNGNIMNKMLTFEENKINNGDYLLINYDDDEDD